MRVHQLACSAISAYLSVLCVNHARVSFDAEIAERRRGTQSRPKNANSSFCIAGITGDLEVFSSLHHLHSFERQSVGHLLDACPADGARRSGTADDLRRNE